MEFRQGHAKTLINNLLKKVHSNRRCGIVYLHVITYNKKACRFYEEFGFTNILEIDDYYLIDDESFNAYLYVMFVNGFEDEICGDVTGGGGSYWLTDGIMGNGNKKPRREKDGQGEDENSSFIGWAFSNVKSFLFG